MNSKRPIPKDICISKIETAIKKLKVALKKEKVAAVAKTIRLLKGSKGDDNATHKLEALKKIDFHQLAVNFVAAELKKRYQRYYRDLAGWAPVIASASSITELERDLLSSKHSMAAQESCFAQLDRTILGIRIQKAVSKKEPKNKIAIPETRLPTEEDAWTSEEDEDLDMIEAMPKAKKNRRGQKERRTIWEKKYGEKANHIIAELKNTKPVVTKPTPSVKRKADEQLHPSWQAKKLQRVAIIPGQGKKIVFGQDDPTPETKAAPKTASSERLHPSWEAKRNKSASIAEFKGSKIVFDD